MRKWPIQVSTVVANVGRELSLLKMAINMTNADYLLFFLWNELEPRCQQRAAGPWSYYKLYPVENIFICERILSITHLGVFGGLHSVHVLLNIVVSTTLKQDER